VLRTASHTTCAVDYFTAFLTHTQVSVTRITPLARPSLVSEFHSRDDLIEALLASCHIPLWMNGNIFTSERGIGHGRICACLYCHSAVARKRTHKHLHTVVLLCTPDPLQSFVASGRVTAA
jgi:hypothetical protein